MTRVRQAWWRVSQTLWFVPSLVIAGLLGLAVVVVTVDRHVTVGDRAFIFSGNATVAESLLSTFATSLITVTGVVLSVTVVVLQLSSGQFSPRILRTFFDDRMTQISIGGLAGVFAYCLLVLRSIHPEQPRGVPEIAVSLAALLALAALGLLIAFIHHVSRRIQVSHLAAHIYQLAAAGIEQARQNAEEGAAPLHSSAAGVLHRPGRVQVPVTSRRPGWITGIDAGAIARAAPSGSCTVIAGRSGDFTTPGQVLATVSAATADDARSLAQAVLGRIAISEERTTHGDIDFGIRQLADTALRAISPSVNDPTTAVTCIGYMHALLAAAVTLPDRPEEIDDTLRDVLVVVPRKPFRESLSMVEEIARYGAHDPRVAVALLEALAGVAAAARRSGHPQRATAAVEIASAVRESGLAGALTTYEESLVDAAARALGKETAAREG